MSGSQYYSSNKSSLFSVEDPVDDDAFLRHPQSGKSGYMIGHDNLHSSNLHDIHQQRLAQKNELQSRMVESSTRSLQLLQNSEAIGVSAAEELLRQREQLERTEKRLDEINSTLRFSQKHIQGIKSVFGSFKNYLSGKSSETPPANTSRINSPVSSSSSTLVDAVEQTKPFVDPSAQTHPALRLRGVEPEPNSLQRQSNRHDPDSQLNENLGEMVTAITRLKGLAQGLGEEIDSQNELVDTIIDKTERADITLNRQNKEINRILKR